MGIKRDGEAWNYGKPQLEHLFSCKVENKMELKKPDDTLLEDMMHSAVTDAALFRTYDDDYQVVDRDQVMRCLANLDGAIKKFNLIRNVAANDLADRGNNMVNFYATCSNIDAIFTALSIMQKNLQKAVEHEAEKVIASRNEMKALEEKE